ncbi:MAG: tetratricopeptide repeat protein, partial [Bacteroidota bacterium]
MKHIILPLLLLFLAASTATSQTYRQYMNAADEAFQEKNYYAAIKYFQQAIAIEGESPELLYKYAEAARLFKAFTFADTAYTKVMNSEKASEYPLAAYWLATVKKEVGAYAEAQALFKQFLASNTRGTHQAEVNHANEEVQELDWAIQAIQNLDENVTIEQLDTNNLNSPYSEFAPAMWNGQLVFSSQIKQVEVVEGLPDRHFSQVFMMKEGSRRVDLAPFNDEKKQTANAAFSPSGKRVYFNLCEYVGESAEIRCEIWYRNIDDKGNFGEAVRLPGNINMPGRTATQPTICFDEATGKETLFFTSDRPGGKGGLDIWATETESDSTFSAPFNLGEINTPGNEVSPFYHNINKHLYFSTDGRQGFGGYDIYKASSMNGGQRWDLPEHLPPPYNSSYNDWHFWLNETQTKGYFASSRLGSHVLEPEFQSCCDDLYSFQIQIVKLNLFTFNKRDAKPLEGVTIDLFE